MPTWDTVQQNIRIMIYTLVGGGVMKGYYDESTATMIVSVVMGVIAWGWWKLWDSKRTNAPA